MKRTLHLVLPALMVSGLVVSPMPTFNGCSLLAWASETRTFGSQGNSGREGRSGRDGQSGQGTSTVADGTARSFSLNGEDGEAGEDGENALRSRCTGQPRNVAYNLQAAHGGNGGSGGSGGHGGSGGSLTIYYQNPLDLRRISVLAQGGRGGRGGRGGLGTIGCRCSTYSWELQSCTGTPGQSDYRCQTSRYRCQDGRDGSNGSNGQDGRTGQDGQLRLVNQLEPLQSENPTQTVRLQALANQSLPLSRNLWATRTGANGLLADGSRVSDTYQEYTGRVEGVVRLDWQAARPASLFATESITASLAEDGTLTADFSEGLWAAYETQRRDQDMVITVTQAVRQQDVTRLAWGGLQGREAGLKAVVLDLAGESAYLNTEFRVVLRTTTDDPRDNRRPRYTTAYEDVIPASAVALDGNRFELNLGQLPIRGRSLRPGTYAQLEIIALRSLGNQSAQQTLTWQGQL